MASQAAEPGAPFPGAAEFAGRLNRPLEGTGVRYRHAGLELGLEPVRSASPDAPRAPEGRLAAITRYPLADVLRSRGDARALKVVGLGRPGRGASASGLEV